MNRIEEEVTKRMEEKEKETREELLLMVGSGEFRKSVIGEYLQEIVDFIKFAERPLTYEELMILDTGLLEAEAVAEETLALLKRKK